MGGDDANVVELRGRTIVPGFIETHSHLSTHAMTLLQADCRTPPNTSIDDIKKRLKEAANKLKPGEWIRGWGYDDTLITEKRHLTKEDLDEASPRNPVFVLHISGHLAYVNSTALQIAGIGPGISQPAGGRIHLDDKGDPTGLLMEEPAISLVTRHIPAYSVTQLKDALLKAIKDYHRADVTSTHDAAIGFFGHGPQVIRAYRELDAEGKLDLRIYMTIVEQLYRHLLEANIGTRFGSDYLKIGGVKLFQDGSIQGFTAALMEDYHNRPGFRGDLILPQKELDDLVRRYHDADVQVVIHANGDKAIESVLQAFERAIESCSLRDNRHMIIHCQLATRDHIHRMRRSGIIPSYFINHVYYWGDRHISTFLGPRRARRIDPLASTVKEGLIFTLHSDLSVTPVDPLFSIHCAANRVTRGGEVLGPEERIDVMEALKAFTTYAAKCSFEEDLKGSISAGKLADFIFLSADLRKVSPSEIKDIKVLQTFVGGRLVYDAGRK